MIVKVGKEKLGGVQLLLFRLLASFIILHEIFPLSMWQTSPELNRMTLKDISSVTSGWQQGELPGSQRSVMTPNLCAGSVQCVGYTDSP